MFAPFAIAPFQSFGALVFGPEIKSFSDVPFRLHSKNLIEFSLAVSVRKSALDDFIEISIRKKGINQLALPSIIK